MATLGFASELVLAAGDAFVSEDAMGVLGWLGSNGSGGAVVAGGGGGGGGDFGFGTLVSTGRPVPGTCTGCCGIATAGEGYGGRDVLLFGAEDVGGHAGP